MRPYGDPDVQCLHPCPVCGTLTEHRAVLGGRRYAETTRLVCMNEHANRGEPAEEASTDA